MIEQSKNIISNMLVAVRVRPPSESEVNSMKIIEAVDNSIILVNPNDNKQNLDFSQNPGKEKQYSFDVVLDEKSTQSQVFSKTTEFLIENVMSGYNASVFAYGPTGTGKTFTMTGTSSNPGLVAKSFSKIFGNLGSLSKERYYKITLSYLEIYNEVIKDLLNPLKENLEIRENRTKGIVVNGLTEILVVSENEALSEVNKGNRRRISEMTRVNSNSSRSHSILSIFIEFKEKNENTGEINIGKLTLIDLAGSERASNTRNLGIRLKEGANINRSLLSLGNCITALSELNAKGGRSYVPYRDSKLTRLLKDSLGGNCKTVMITCISPCAFSYDDTYNTLNYACRAKNIKIRPVKNTVNTKKNIVKYSEVIKKLNQEVSKLKSQLKMPQDDIEKYLVKLKGHFQEETMLRKTIYINEQKIDDISYMLFEKQMMVIIEKETGDEEDGEKHLEIEKEIHDLNKSALKIEKKIQDEKESLHDLVKKREVLELEWINNGLKQPFLSMLTLELKKHCLMMNDLDFQGIEKHNKSVLDQKDMYIKILEDQIKVRDCIIKQDLPSIDQNRLKKIKSLDQIASNPFFYSLSPLKKNKEPENYVSASKIPMPKSVINTSVEPRRYVIKKNYQINYNDQRSHGRYNIRDRGYSIESRISGDSSASTFIEPKTKLVSEKYYNSPYFIPKLKLVTNLSP